MPFEVGQKNGGVMMNIQEFEKMLIAKSEELQGVNISKEEIAIERTAELLDEIQRTAEREIALDALNRNWQSRSLVSEALNRIANGEYGICTECEEPISERRLKAIPWAKCCIKCQEQLDANAAEDVEWRQAA
jgi:DnaK suppressor protein